MKHLRAAAIAIGAIGTWAGSVQMLSLPMGDWPGLWLNVRTLAFVALFLVGVFWEVTDG